MNFVHLHVHSHYSLLDGLSQIDDIIKFAKADGANAIALTDHGVMYGAIEFYQKAIKAGVKPIIGMETYLAPGSRFDKTYSRGERTSYHLLLLAKNHTGYKNLIKLTSLAHLEGYYYKPRVDWELLSQYHDGLIACSACLAGEIPSLIVKEKLPEAKARLSQYAELFGPDNFYLELQYHPDLPQQALVNEQLIALARELNLPLVATNDAHYINKEDDEAQDILLCLQNKTKKDDPNRMSMLGGDYSLIPGRKMEELFKDAPAATANTVRIAEACNLEIELGKVQLPHFEVPAGLDGNAYLRQLALAGLVKRYGKTYEAIEPVYRERLDYELSVIERMGWPSYFLIVADFVNWAKDNKIVVGPGRGSAAGSLVCFCLGITNLCPIKYELLFERFLNPDRISMPDIDMDFADIRRDDVIRYVQAKYGENRVAQIITFGTMAARAAIRDVGRVLDYPYDFCDKLAKTVPMFMTLAKTLAEVAEFQELYKNPDAKRIVDYALKLEGVARHASIHACGILITKEALTENVPVQYASASDQTIVSQYSLHPTEDLGLLKMDFLGLKNLTIIESAIRIIKNTRGLELDMETIPLDDSKTYDLFQKGETTGVFQFECLSGDTIVSNTTIKKLYEKNNKEKLLSVYLNDGAVHKNKILKVVESGVKELNVLVAENNWQIKATKDHKFLTADGWKKLADLKVGEKILIKNKSKHLVYNLCQNCGKQISGQKEGESDFCYRCSAEHYSNPSKKEARDKIKAARINFFQNGGEPWNLGLTIENSETMKATGRKISTALSGKTLEYFYGSKKAAEIRKRMSERASGKNNPMFGKPSPHRKGGFREDLGHYVRSTWEADFARILKLHNLDYQYEPRTFKLVRSNGEILHYTPDFYTKSDNTFYEIKGWMHDLDQEKIDLFKKQYPEYNFVLISSTKFSEFALQYKQLIKWECPKIPDNFNFVKVKKIKPCGREMTYDIAMQPPGNNFIANGFVVHNSSGMKRYLKELQPTEFEDLIAMVALYRPGPMEWIPDYIAGKHGRKKPTYLHPKLEPILQATYGVAIYQEQVMRMARDLAGFSMGEADVLRKAVGKKIAKLLAGERQKFIDGCVKNGLTSDLAATIFSFIEPFAGYGFNRSHAACYAMVAYQTAYLKANWPTEFMAALLTSDQDDSDRIAIEIEECRNMGIEVKQPDINQSFESFTVVTSGTAEGKTAAAGEQVKTIRFGLKAIKNVGEHIAEVLIRQRKAGGPYRDMADLLERIEDKDLNKKSLESLIKGGAFDQFGDRGLFLTNLDNLLNFHRQFAKDKDTNQVSLFGAAVPELKPKLTLAPAAPIANAEKLAWEKELLGLYVSEHPFTDYKRALAGLALGLGELKRVPAGNEITVAGVIIAIKKILTKKNETMLFVKIEDGVDSTEILVFPKLLKDTAAVWQSGKVILCSGTASDKDNEMKILANKAVELTLTDLPAQLTRFKALAAPRNGYRNGNGNGYHHNGDFVQRQTGGDYSQPASTPAAPLKLIIKQAALTPELTARLKDICLSRPGESKVYLKIVGADGDKVVEANARVDISGDLLKLIKEELGEVVRIIT